MINKAISGYLPLLKAQNIPKTDKMMPRLKKTFNATFFTMLVDRHLRIKCLLPGQNASLEIV